MQARIVYFDGCPNAASAAALVQEVASSLGRRVEIERVCVETPEDAVRERMLGSPTILIDGVDVEPAARRRTDFAMSCRVYRGRDGLPARGMVEAALMGQEYQGSDDQNGRQDTGCAE